MGAPVRFLFDNDFAVPPPEADHSADEDQEDDGSRIDLEIHLAEVRNAESAAYERGLRDGQRSAEVVAQEQLALHSQHIAEAADRMITLIDGDMKRVEADAMSLSATIARKIARFALAHFPDSQILGLIEECLSPLRTVRHLAVRVHEADVDRLKAPIEDLAAQNGFEGRLLILGEPDTKPGDCRLEWADGGILFDRDDLSRTIDAAIVDHLGPGAGEADREAEAHEDDPQPSLFGAAEAEKSADTAEAGHPGRSADAEPGESARRSDAGRQAPDPGDNSPGETGSGETSPGEMNSE